jgi:hypothetical protein
MPYNVMQQAKVSVLEAAMEGARKYFPSYFDDFVAVHFTDFPLVLSGPGKISNRTIGFIQQEDGYM